MPSMSKVNVSFLPSMTKPSNYNLLILLVISALCAIVPLDLTQLIFAVLGALCYYMVQSLQRSMGVPGQKKLPKSPIEKAEPREVKKRRTNRKPLTEGTHVDAAAQPACVPILAPKFKGESLEDEVQELIAQIMPTASSQRGVDRLAEAIRVMLASSLPEVEVTGFANSDLSRGRANGVAVPDVDIVIQVRPDSVASKLPSKGVAEPRMLQKWALRICADRLVSGGFKFRRSGFRGNEPKMTLLVPSELKIFDTAVPIDISVNAVTPLHSAALISECGNLNPQSKELILLIRRWAKDRGICHAPKGHLSPYVWSLLVVYYLQVAQKEPLLPPVAEFQAIKDLLPAGCGKTAQPWRGKASELTAAGGGGDQEEVHIEVQRKMSETAQPANNHSAQAQTSEASKKSSKKKVEVLLKAAGDAPIMVKKKWQVDGSKQVAYIIEFIRKYIKCEPQDSLFVYVGQCFAPTPDQTLQNLYNCFGADGKLVLHYCKTQAWG